MLKFVAIGPPKSGTTLIQNLLIQHPDIYLSPKKEIQFFNHNFEKGYDWYNDHFKNATTNQLIGEVSPTYCDSPETLQRIKEYADKNGDDLKIIVTVRNPIKRLLSEYYHNLKRANYDITIQKAINEELIKKRQGKFYKIVRNSRYNDIMTDVYRLFNKKNVLVIDSDEEIFKDENLKITIKKIEDFLLVSHKDDYALDVEDNASYVPKSYAVQKLVFHNKGLKSVFRSLIPSFKIRHKIRGVIKKFNTKKSGYETNRKVSKEESDNIYNKYLKDDFEKFKKNFVST